MDEQWIDDGLEGRSLMNNLVAESYLLGCPKLFRRQVCVVDNSTIVT